jgi:hypothetical protein
MLQCCLLELTVRCILVWSAEGKIASLAAGFLELPVFQPLCHPSIIYVRHLPPSYGLFAGEKFVAYQPVRVFEDRRQGGEGVQKNGTNGSGGMRKQQALVCDFMAGAP